MGVYKMCDTELGKIISLSKEVAEPYMESARAWKCAFYIVAFLFCVSVGVNAYLATKNLNVNLIAEDNIESDVNQSNG